MDGRNRYKAALEAGVDIPFEQYSGDDPLGFVISKNLARRHLDTSQRAMVAAKMANLAPGSNQNTAKEPGRIRHSDAAKAMNVSHTSVVAAKRVQREAAPEVIEAVESGKMSLNAAMKTVT